MKVAIIAGGIVGLATAIALRPRSIEADVYEQASAWEALGAGILVPCKCDAGAAPHGNRQLC